MTLETLQQRLEAAAADLDFGLPLSARSARRLACDARLVPVILGAEGQPLDVGRITYSCPMPMRRALVARDRGCCFPGCGAPPTRCDAHHVEHWAAGGSTALCNLCLLCRRHHRMIHAGEWAVRINTDGHPEFLPPPWVDPQRRPIRPHRVTLDTLRRTRDDS